MGTEKKGKRFLGAFTAISANGKAPWYTHILYFLVGLIAIAFLICSVEFGGFFIFTVLSAAWIFIAYVIGRVIVELCIMNRRK